MFYLKEIWILASF